MRINCSIYIQIQNRSVVCFIPPKATHCQEVKVPDDLYVGIVVGSKGQNITDLNKKLSGCYVILHVGPMYSICC